MGLALGDFNSDGKLDVATADYGLNNVTILLGNGNGTFKSPAQVALANGQSVQPWRLRRPMSTKTAYWISLRQFRDDNVSVLGQRGTFSLSASYGTGTGATSPRNVALGDVNRDGNVDIVAANCGLGTAGLAVLLGSGNGSFGPATTYGTTIGAVKGLALGDINQDGYPDAVISSGTAGQVAILLGSPAGTFGSGVTYGTPSGSSNSAIAVGYLNVDGLLNIVTPDKGLPLISTLGTLGGAAYSVGTETNYSAGSGIVTLQSAAYGDFNKDGFQDIAAVDSNTSHAFIWLGNSSGALTLIGTTPGTGAGTGPVYVAVGDVNHDGSLDLVTANSTGNSISVLLGNGNGTFQTAITDGPRRRYATVWPWSWATSTPTASSTSRRPTTAPTTSASFWATATARSRRGLPMGLARAHRPPSLGPSPPPTSTRTATLTS